MKALEERMESTLQITHDRHQHLESLVVDVMDQAADMAGTSSQKFFIGKYALASMMARRGSPERTV
jgi:hypothetical protein